MPEDIQVITVDPVTGAVTFGLVPVIISGLQLLVQIVVLSLLNTPGKDVLNPTAGGGIPSLLGSNIDPTNMSEVATEVGRLVKNTQTEILANQTGLDLQPSEKLRSLTVLAVAPGAEIDQIAVQLSVINENGQIASIVL